MTQKQKAALPKSKLISIHWVSFKRWPRDYNHRSPFFITWRNANARGFFFGQLMVIIRRPWLEHAARALYPEIFAQESRP